MRKSRFFKNDWIESYIEELRKIGVEIDELEADHIRAKAVNDMIDCFWEEEK